MSDYADAMYEASHNVASFLKAMDEANVPGAAEARRAFRAITLSFATKGEDSECMELIHLIRFAYEAGKQAGESGGGE